MGLTWQPYLPSPCYYQGRRAPLLAARAARLKLASPLASQPARRACVLVRSLVRPFASLPACLGADSSTRRSARPVAAAAARLHTRLHAIYQPALRTWLPAPTPAYPPVRPSQPICALPERIAVAGPYWHPPRRTSVRQRSDPGVCVFSGRLR